MLVRVRVRAVSVCCGCVCLCVWVGGEGGGLVGKNPATCSALGMHAKCCPHACRPEAVQLKRKGGRGGRHAAQKRQRHLAPLNYQALGDVDGVSVGRAGAGCTGGDWLVALAWPVAGVWAGGPATGGGWWQGQRARPAALRMLPRNPAHHPQLQPSLLTQTSRLPPLPSLPFLRAPDASPRAGGAGGVPGWAGG